MSCSSDTEELAPVIKYTLTTSVTPSTAGTITPASGEHIEGTIVELTATPNTGYNFTGWSGSINVTSNPLTISMTGDISITATFQLIVDTNPELTLRSEFANENNSNVVTSGIFAIWWDKNFEHQHQSESEYTFKLLSEIRDKSINELGMPEPPNLAAGYYLNIYIHHDNDIFSDKKWGNGVGTNSYGLPFMTTGEGGAIDELNVFHEGFHLFQYKQNSPGFSYSGDGMWYTESSAQWFAFVNEPNLTNAIIEAAALVFNPQLALWHSFSNRASYDIVTWLYEVRQYALHGLLYYLTDVEDVNESLITSGFSAGTNLLPQEYLYENIGAESFRTFFGNWAAANTANLSYLTREQVERAHNEVKNLISAGITSVEYKNEFAIEIDGNNAQGTYSPEEYLRPRSWAYNVVRISNSAGNSYNFNFIGETLGSEDASSFFEVRIVKKAGEDNYTTTNFEIDNGLTGSKTVTLNDNEEEFYVVIISVPEQFTGNQNYNYSLTISQ
ncbi:MAG: putative repeat protein (TIGR02543 family) [Flavobacteriaceae bacterium]